MILRWFLRAAQDSLELIGAGTAGGWDPPPPPPVSQQWDFRHVPQGLF